MMKRRWIWCGGTTALATTEKPDLRQLKATLLAEMEATDAAELAQIPDRALTWMALAPVWTVPIAYACNFPTDGARVEDLFERMIDLGLCVQSHPAVRLTTLVSPTDPSANAM